MPRKNQATIQQQGGKGNLRPKASGAHFVSKKSDRKKIRTPGAKSTRRVPAR